MSVNAVRKQSSDEEVQTLAKSLIKTWKKLLGTDLLLFFSHCFCCKFIFLLSTKAICFIQRYFRICCLKHVQMTWVEMAALLVNNFWLWAYSRQWCSKLSSAERRGHKLTPLTFYRWFWGQVRGEEKRTTSPSVVIIERHSWIQWLQVCICVCEE